MNRRPQLSQWVVVLLALAVFINMVDRGNLATAAPLLRNGLALTNSQMGVLLSAFFWAYAPALPLAGWMAHRFDVRVVLAGGLVVWSLATVLTGFAAGFATLLIARLLLGLGYGASARPIHRDTLWRTALSPTMRKPFQASPKTRSSRWRVKSRSTALDGLRRPDLYKAADATVMPYQVAINSVE